jgi:hypothetical protein
VVRAAVVAHGGRWRLERSLADGSALAPAIYLTRELAVRDGREYVLQAAGSASERPRDPRRARPTSEGRAGTWWKERGAPGGVVRAEVHPDRGQWRLERYRVDGTALPSCTFAGRDTALQVAEAYLAEAAGAGRAAVRTGRSTGAAPYPATSPSADPSAAMVGALLALVMAFFGGC